MSLTDKPIQPTDVFAKFFATSSGGHDMNVAGSGSTGVKTFFVTPSTDREGSVEIHAVNFHLMGPEIFVPSFFGSASSALANGVKVEVLNANDDILVDYLDGETVKDNSDWVHLVGVDVINAPASSVGSVYEKPMRWQIDEVGGPLLLGQGSKLRISIQDDISSSGILTHFEATAVGHYRHPVK